MLAKLKAVHEINYFPEVLRTNIKSYPPSKLSILPDLYSDILLFLQKMRNKIAEFKEQIKDEDSALVSRDTEELATLLREKTHLEDLQNESMKKQEARQQQGGQGDRMQQVKQQDDPLKHLTPRERMRIRKMQAADRKAQELR